MSKQVEKVHSIDGYHVTKESEFDGIEVFSRGDEYNTEVVVYFCKGDEVFQELHLEADMGQGIGFISLMEFKEP